MWEHLDWIILSAFGIRFIYKDLPKIIRIWRNTGKYGDDDPGGNDNVNRKFNDYM